MKIHKEGHRILIFSFILFTAVDLLAWFFGGNIFLYIALIITIPLFIFMLRFFRVPNRSIDAQENKVLAPCDGKVVVIEEVDEHEVIGGKCIQVSIFMSVWNVHINWFPILGKVIYRKYHPGKFLLAWEPKSSTLNERNSVAVEHPNGSIVLFRQIAGFLARRIACYTNQGDTATQGQEMGFIKFGSRIDLFLPLNSTIKVEIGQKVTGTQSTIAVLPNQ